MVYDIKTPLEVTVKVWPDSIESGREGGCPLYGQNPLDSTRSSATDGMFRIRIDPDKNPIFTVIYCANGYYPRVDSDLRASDDAVFSEPVELFPSNSPVSDVRFEKEIILALNKLAYFRSMDSDKFDSAANRVGKGRAAGLSAVVVAWRPRPKTTSTLTVLNRVNEEQNLTYAIAYSKAIASYSRVDPSRQGMDEAAVDSNPVRIMRATRQASDARVEREILSELNKLAYLRSIDAVRFDSAAKRLGGRRAEGLPAVLTAWRPQR